MKAAREAHAQRRDQPAGCRYQAVLPRRRRHVRGQSECPLHWTREGCRFTWTVRRAMARPLQEADEQAPLGRRSIGAALAHTATPAHTLGSTLPATVERRRACCLIEHDSYPTPALGRI